MQTFVDPASPRFRLSFAELPRGVVKFPDHIVAAVDEQKARFGPAVFTEDYVRRTLERHTLVWYYEGLPVAYRPVADGIEVLGLGWEEVARHSSDPNAILAQP